MQTLLLWLFLTAGGAAIVAAWKRSRLFWPLLAAEWITAGAYVAVFIASGGDR